MIGRAQCTPGCLINTDSPLLNEASLGRPNGQSPRFLNGMFGLAVLRTHWGCAPVARL